MIRQPEPKPDILARRDAIVAGLRELLPPDGVIAEPLLLKPYETDGLAAYHQVPLVVVLPETTEQVAAVMAFCNREGVRVVPRGAGTSLSGGALPLADGVVLGLMRMNRILDINYDDRCATVQAGVTNMGITTAVQGRGFFYAPDPSSQLACMIGGNVNMNSGGAHCLRYGVTANNLLGLRIVTIKGEIVEIGGAHMDAAGYDWLGLLTGSEGMLAVVTEVTVRILRGPEGARAMLAAFKSNEVAGACVDAIISSGIIPVALEFMDRPAIHACEAFAHAGYPLDAEAMLIIEVEGSPTEQDFLLLRLKEICSSHDPISLKVSQSAAESAAIWKGRKRCIRRGRAHQPRLPLHGRRNPHQPPARGAAPHRRNERRLRPAGGKHLPRRRRQSASADHVRCQRPRQFRHGGEIRRRHPEALRRSRRLPHRRARGRCGEARPDGRAVFRHRTGAAAPGEIGVRPRLAAESVESLSSKASMNAATDEAGIAAAITAAHAASEPLLICGNNTKAGLLRPVQAARSLSTQALTGISLYSPNELVLSARAGTPITEIAATVAAKGQHLISEPPDFSALLSTTGAQTIGGIVATNVSGPRRVAWGATRDHVLGVRAVNGIGETIHSGGRVLKNVTGLDLCKLLSGSHVTLAVLTEITIKVLPAPERRGTLVLKALDPTKAVAALAAALGSPYAVSGAAYLPAALAARIPVLAWFGASVTLARIEDFAPSVAYRTDRLRADLAEFGAAEILDDGASQAVWSAVRDATPLAGEPGAIWRASVRPSAGPAVARAVETAFSATWFMDWGGGLLWIAGPATEAAHAAVTSAARAGGGTWTLFRAPEGMRAAVEVIPPESPPLARITRGIKAAFDPRGILNPGRMYAGL